MDDKHVINCNDVPEIDMTRQDGGLEHKAGVYTYQIRTNTIQEVTVVRHHQDTDIGPAQIIFQPFGHLQIQMVRRLIQDNQFRVRDQDIRQGYRFNCPPDNSPIF